MDVAKISAGLAGEIDRQKYNGSEWPFNPVQDIDGNHIVNLEQAQMYLSPEQYEIITWAPPPEEIEN